MCIRFFVAHPKKRSAIYSIINITENINKNKLTKETKNVRTGRLRSATNPIKNTRTAPIAMIAIQIINKASVFLNASFNLYFISPDSPPCIP